MQNATCQPGRRGEGLMPKMWCRGELTAAAEIIPGWFLFCIIYVIKSHNVYVNTKSGLNN